MTGRRLTGQMEAVSSSSPSRFGDVTLTRPRTGFSAVDCPEPNLHGPHTAPFRHPRPVPLRRAERRRESNTDRHCIAHAQRVESTTAGLLQGRRRLFDSKWPWALEHRVGRCTVHPFHPVRPRQSTNSTQTMPLFGKKSSSKIPPPEEAQPYGSPFGSGGPTPGPYGSRDTSQLYGQQQQQPPRGGAGYGARPPPQQGGYGSHPPPGYGGYQQQGPNTQAMFKDAKAPSANLGRGYDQMFGGGSAGGKNSRLANNAEDDLEAEYGAGSAASSSRYDTRGHGNYDGLEQQEEARDEEDDEVEAVKQQMRFTKQESLSSTRNALRIARETEETATNTVLKLGEQSDKIANTERHLDMSKAHSSRADDNAHEIVALNRSIFRPNIQFNKKAKRDAEEARIMNRHIEEREEREAVRAEALKSQNRADQVLTGAGTGSGRFADRFGGGRFGGGNKPVSAEDARKNKLAQRSRYQFEATESDDDLEQELEDNLDEIGNLSSRLNQLGRAMGTEIDEQVRRGGEPATIASEALTYARTRANRIHASIASLKRQTSLTRGFTVPHRSWRGSSEVMLCGVRSARYDPPFPPLSIRYDEYLHCFRPVHNTLRA